MRTPLEELKAALADRYAIEEEIGAGGMATVYRARDLKHERPVAIKVLKPKIASLLGAERFLQEIRVTANLQHSHILPLHDSGDVAGILYYVMPFVEGESLRARLDRETQLSLQDAVRITGDIASALEYAHAEGIIHRDIKPENILLSHGEAMLADFGVARALDKSGQKAITTGGLVLGTPSYMSPEQAAGGAIDGRSDTFALACVAYEMVGGTPPYTGPTPQAIHARQAAGEVPPIGSIRPTVRPELDRVLKRALTPTPADRYQTPMEFARAFRAAASGRGLRNSLDQIRSLPRVSRRTMTLALGLLLAAAAVVTLLVWLPSRGAAAARPASLVIFPFRGQGEEGSRLGEGIADLLAATLDGTVGLSVADPNTMWRSLRDGEGKPLRVPELGEALGAAKRVSARNVVLGSVTASGASLNIAARIYNAVGDVLATLSATGPADSLAPAVHRLAIDIVADVWQRDSLPTVPAIERLATDDPEALKAYLEAKRLIYAGDYPAAEAPIDRAVELDSTFALALMTQFEVRSWNLFLNGRPFIGLTPIIDQAMRHRDRLSLRERLRVEAAKALDNTDGETAATDYDRILGIDSLDLGARRGLAFTYLAYGWQLHKGFPEIAAAYDRVLAVDSTDLNALNRLLSLGIWMDDAERRAEVLARLATLDTTPVFVAGVLYGVHILSAEGAAQDSVLDVVTAQPGPIVISVIRELRSTRPRLLERLIERLRADSMPAFHRRLALGTGTQLAMAAGRVAQTEARLRGGALDVFRPAVNRMMVAATLTGVGDSAATARALEELAASSPPDSMAAIMETDQQPWMAGWSVGAYQASLGDTTAARVWQAAIAALPQGLDWPWQEALAADIESRIALRRGDLETAEAKAREAYQKWIIHSGNVNEGEPEPNMRFHLAEVLRVRGKAEEAKWLYRSFGPPHNWAGYLTARASYELGGIAEAEGDWSEAVFRYGQALGLWELGGDDIAPWRDKAREGLERALERVG